MSVKEPGMKAGQYLVIWHPMLYRPAVAKHPVQITAIGKRMKASAVDSDRFYLLKPDDILAVYDDLGEAKAMALTLHEIGEDHARRERKLLSETTARILETANAPPRPTRRTSGKGVNDGNDE